MKGAKKCLQEKEVFLSEKAKQLFQTIDFADTFSTTNHFHTLEEVSRRIFTLRAKWIILLFKLRNSIVKRFKLKTDMPPNYEEVFKVGGHIGFFEIYDILEKEVILGANDKHLNFRVSICNTQASTNNIKVTTLVQFNNQFGKMYMKLIAPFHRLVVKAMVRQAYCDKAPSAALNI